MLLVDRMIYISSQSLKKMRDKERETEETGKEYEVVIEIPTVLILNYHNF
jgi:hypothetical protein